MRLETLVKSLYVLEKKETKLALFSTFVIVMFSGCSVCSYLVSRTLGSLSFTVHPTNTEQEKRKRSMNSKKKNGTLQLRGKKTYVFLLFLGFSSVLSSSLATES